MLRTLCIAITAMYTLAAINAFAQTKLNEEDYLGFNYGEDTGGEQWVQSIKVTSPEYRAKIKGDTVISFRAPGMKFAKAMCWQQPTDEHPGKWGHDAELTPEGIELDRSQGSFVFHADKFPNGPINVRIFANNGKGLRDICELQLFNEGGVKWNQGAPDAPPPAARGMTLAFTDDFDSPPSISADGRGATYNAHKPFFGDFSGWPFRDPDWEPAPPFEQVDTWLRIKARKPEGTRGGTGLLATVDMDGNGFWAKPPCYIEARLTAQSAPGTWPAFWTLTEGRDGHPGDELDIAELYGGVGKGHPNSPGYYATSHFWGQTNSDGSKKKTPSRLVKIMDLGSKSYWSTGFHTYGLLITQKDTIYYFDDIEVFRHPTNEMSMRPHILLINYAIGGISGWPIDLERYGNGSDMWVDYIRVYQK